MKTKVAVILMAVGIAQPLAISGPVAAAGQPCQYVQKLPYSAHYEPEKLPTRFATKAKACGRYSKRTGEPIAVSFGSLDSTVWGWSHAVYKAIKHAGGHVTFVDNAGDSGVDGTCTTNNAVCVWPNWG
jgi:hypothetical protein